MNYVGEPIHRDSLDRLQKSPLINMGLKQFIQENSVPLVSREFLQGQGNQFSKSIFGHSVLAREKSVIRIEPYFVAFFPWCESAMRTLAFSRRWREPHGRRTSKHAHHFPTASARRKHRSGSVDT